MKHDREAYMSDFESKSGFGVMSDLYQSALAGQPLFESKEKALEAITLTLTQLAADSGKTVLELIAEAHTAQNFLPAYVQALSLERQIAFLSCK